MRWLAFVAVSCLVFIVALSMSSSAKAEPVARSVSESQVSSADYKMAIQHAVAEYEAGNYPEARAWFTRAHELEPSARTLFGLALTAFELRNYKTCVEYLEAALGSDVKPLSKVKRSEAEGLLARARAMIARVDLELSPSASRVLVDGVPVELSQGQALVLEVGDHVVEVQAPGYLPERRALSILGERTSGSSFACAEPLTPTAPRPNKARSPRTGMPRAKTAPSRSSVAGTRARGFGPA